jgi:predicted ATPase
MFETNYSGNISFNLSLQGSGTQNVLSIIATLIFSPNNSTIIIEEPEICLHSRSQEVVVDLINDVVNRENKQVIFSTHSWDMILPLISDMEIGSPRGKDHIIANPDYLKIHTFTPKNGNIPIEEYDFKGKKYIDIRNDFKTLWG